MSEVLEDSGEQYQEPAKYVKIEGRWGQVGDLVQLSDYNFRWRIGHTTSSDSTCYMTSLVGGRKVVVPNGFFTVVERLDGFVPKDWRDEYKVSSGEWGSE